MNLEIRQASIAQLAIYAEIPGTFEVDQVFDISEGRDGEYVLSARPSLSPYVKDYDADNGGPPGWVMRFDVATWGLLIARIDGQPVGGAAVASGVPDLDLLNGAADTAVLWDIRVAASARRQGVGTALFHAVETWAAAERCQALVIETQNVNVPAGRLYEQCGCVLRKVRHDAYLDYPDEIQMLWEKRFERGLGL